MNQSDLMRKVLDDTDNMRKLGVSDSQWQVYRSRYRKGKVADKLQVKILKDLGYEIIQERQWK